MNKKEYRLFNVIMIIVVVGFAILTVKLSSNQPLADMIKSIGSSQKASTNSSGQGDNVAKCTDKKPLKLDGPKEPHLAKLRVYQQVCDSFVTSTLMYFTAFPENQIAAQGLAKSVSDVLKQFKQAGVTPIMIIEPYLSDGAMSYRKYINGEYDEAVSTFFSLLQRNGIDDSMMGTWVPFPESNTPSWDNKDTQPSDFAVVVNKYLRAMKSVFPKAKGSILLSATTYQVNDLEYENGDYISLIPYVEDIDSSLVSSVGIQGFPWVSRVNQSRREIFRASEFLQPDYAVEAARHLRTRDIWFNSGAFASKYTNDSDIRVNLSDSDRKGILDDIVVEVKKIKEIQQNQYRVSVNIFAEDKSETVEATDWSFLGSDAAKNMFKSFVNKLDKDEVTVSLYDK